MVMKMHPEFQQLTQSQQVKLWKSNKATATALTIAKLECAESGNEQAFLMAGSDDWQTWSYQFLKDRPLKKLLIPDANKFLAFFSPEVSKRFAKLVKHIGAFTRRDETFKLFVLILLFSDTEDIPAVKMLQKNYLNVIRRRQYSGRYISTQPSEANIVDKFCACISDVKELATMLPLMGPKPTPSDSLTV